MGVHSINISSEMVSVLQQAVAYTIGAGRTYHAGKLDEYQVSLGDANEFLKTLLEDERKKARRQRRRAKRAEERKKSFGSQPDGSFLIPGFMKRAKRKP